MSTPKNPNGAPIVDLARQEWLRQPTTAQLLERIASLRFAAAWGWFFAAVFAVAYLCK
jgi:hypothetical protein